MQVTHSPHGGFLKEHFEGESIPAVQRVMNKRLGELEQKGHTFVRQEIKVGRNQPCPCRSGLKFKRCCLGKA